MRNKVIVFYVFFIGVVISSLVYSSFILDFTLVPRLACLSVVLIFSALLLKSGGADFLRLDIITLPYLLFVLFSCFSFVWANTKAEAIFESSKLLSAIAVFFMSNYFFKEHKEQTLQFLCRLSVVIFLIELVYVIFQLSQINSFYKEELYNVFGLNSHKNLLASFLLLNLFFLILGVFNFKKTWKIVAIISAVLSLCIILAIQTKAVWLALILAFVSFLILFYNKRVSLKVPLKWSIAILMVIVNLFFIFIQPQIIKMGLHFNANQVTSTKTELDNERLMLWDKTYEMIKKHPMIGVGAGNWQIYFPDANLTGMYRAEDLNYTFQRPHNDVLWIIAETGFIGVNLFLFFVISILVLLVRTIKFVKYDRTLLLQLALTFSVIIGFFAASFFDFPKERIEHLIWINIVFAFAYNLIKQHDLIKPIVQLKFSRLYKGIAVICFVYIGLIAFSRYKGEYYTRKMYDHKKTGNSVAVIQDGKKAINFAYSIDPTSLPITWYTGNAYAILGNYRQAKIDLWNAYESNPFNRNVINDLGSAYVSINQIDSAKHYYCEASRISPRFDDPKLNLVALYFNDKQFEKADSCLKTLLHDSERRTKYQAIVNAFLGKK